MCVTFIIYHLLEAVLHSRSSWPVASITWVTRCCSWGSLEHLWHVLTLKHVGGSVANQIQGISHQFHLGLFRSDDGNDWYKVLGDSVIGCFDSSMRSCQLRWHWNARKDVLIVPELRLLNHGVSSGLVTDRNMWLSILETWTCSFWDVMVIPKNPFSETPQSWVSFDSYNIGLSIPMVVGWGIQREHKLFYQGTT